MTSALKNSLGVLGTLAFAIPGPWGVLASAALQALGMVIPDDDGPDPTAKAFLECKTDIENFITANQLGVDAGFLTSIKNWIDTNDRIDDLFTNPAQLVQSLKDLGSLLDVVTPLDTAFNDLETKFAKFDDKQPFCKTAQAALSTYLALRLAVAQCLSLRISYSQSLSQLYADSGKLSEQQLIYSQQQETEAAYFRLKAYIEEFICGDTALAYYRAALDQIHKSRLGQISDVRYDTNFNAFDKYYYYCQDSDLSGSQRFDLCQSPYRDDSNAQSWHNIYVNNIESDLQAFEDDLMSMPSQGKAILDKAPKNPAPPSQAPSVDIYDTSWTKAWQQPGKFVQYRFYLLYPLPPGRSTLSPIGPLDPVTALSTYIQTGAANEVPHITFPDDPSGFAISRVLIRTVADDALGTNATDYLIAIGNMEPEFYDLWPVDQDNVAPNADSAPILRWANYNKDPAPLVRTWPDPYHVRYCYFYVNKAGKSIQHSPWSVPMAPADYDIDQHGFIQNSNYYSFQMLVPIEDGCDFELQRQFSGDPQATTIKHRTKPSDMPGKMFLCDDAGP